MTPLGGKPRTTASFDLSSCSLFLFTAWLAIDAAIKLKRGVTDLRSSKSKSHGNDGSLVGDSGYTYKDPWSEARATFLLLAVPSSLRKTYSRQSHTSISSSLLLPLKIFLALISNTFVRSVLQSEDAIMIPQPWAICGCLVLCQWQFPHIHSSPRYIDPSDTPSSFWFAN